MSRKGGAGPGDRGRLLNPVVGDGGWGLDRAIQCYLTLPTAIERLSLIDTQTPEFCSDWRFR